jgi:hypothetical protein
MMEKLWETAQGRFGARAMRACLESHSATKEQQVNELLMITDTSVLWQPSSPSTASVLQRMPMARYY